MTASARGGVRATAMFLLVVLLSVSLPAAAAATVTVSSSGGTLAVAGDAVGEAVRIRLSGPNEFHDQADSPHYVVSTEAPSTTLVAGAGCHHAGNDPNSLRWVACPAGAITVVEADLGDGADSITVGGNPPAPVTARGGAGDDVLSHYDGGTVTLFGDAGNDVVNFLGGPSTAYGGTGDDVFAYNSTAATTSFGEAGADRFNAAYRGGRQTIDAGPDADEIDVRAGGSDVVRCGEGVDRAIADPTDEVAADCEPTASVGDELDEAIAAAGTRLRALTLRSLARRGLTLTVPDDAAGAWSAELRARTARWTRIAFARERTSSNGDRKLVLRLNRAGRALARSAPRLRVRLRIMSGRQSRTRTVLVRR